VTGGRKFARHHFCKRPSPLASGWWLPHGEKTQCGRS
jgi:hypothetical protein